MRIEAACPKCGKLNVLISEGWHDVGFMPVECSNCLVLYWGEVFSDIEKSVISETKQFLKEEIPELEEGTEVFLIHRDHKYHLEPGVVIDRDHKHYRIKFHDDKVIWFPSNLVQKIPDEL